MDRGRRGRGQAESKATSSLCSSSQTRRSPGLGGGVDRRGSKGSGVSLGGKVDGAAISLDIETEKRASFMDSF